MSNQITANGQSPSKLADIPSIRTFQMGGGGIGNIANSVNLFRGDVNLPLELVSLPGRGDLDVKIAIMYQSNIQNLVDTWNLEAPTGILGLGWNMPYEMIAIDNKSTGDVYDDEYYLVSGGSANRLYQDGVTEDGAWNFETEDYKPWDIRYYPNEEKWVIVKENGVTQIYGGKKDNLPENNPYIQWGIKWGGTNGNWIDSTTNTSGQVPIAKAWNLAEISNTWGEKVTFNYEVDLEEIGVDGYNYTRACYLQKITALDGRVVNFTYGEKEYTDSVREYQIFHQDSSQANLHAYQNSYETKFLDSIAVCDGDSNSLLFSMQFAYDLQNVSLTDINHADFYKRYLKSITQVSSERKSLPNYYFDYYTDRQNINENTNRGALKSVTYPTGGIASFTYEKTTLIGTSRKISISGNGIPRVWFGSDYVVVCYYDDSGSGNLSITIYSWNGNWIEDTKTITGKLDINSLQVVTQSDFFALSFKTGSEMKVYLFHQELGRFGQWQNENYYLDLASSDVQTQLAAGSNFVVYCASGGKNLGRYVWNQKSKSWDDKSITINSGNYALSAYGNYFTLAIHNDTAKSCELALYYLDTIYTQWYLEEIATVSSVEADTNGNPYLNWSLGSNFATVTFIKSFGSNIDYEVRVYQWNNDFNIAQKLSNSYSVTQDTQNPFYYSITSESLIGNVQHLWRYNGSKWQESSLSITDGEITKFAYGSDLAIASNSTSSNLKIYDPYRDQFKYPNITGSWSKDEYQPTISGSFITVGNAIFYEDNQGELTKLQSLPSSGVKPESIINRGFHYIACETTDGETQIFLLKNGKVVDTGYLSERIYVDNESSKGKSGTMLAGFSAFVTYKGDNFDQASNLKLYYVTNAEYEGHVIDFPVTKVTINDGYQESYTSYDYDTSNVVISALGTITEYPHITMVQGSHDPKLTPFGKIESYFFNGLSVEGLGFSDFQGNPPYYYSALHGCLYQQISYNATGVEVTFQTNEYEVETTRQTLVGSTTVNLYGYYVQQIRQKSILYCKKLNGNNSNDNSANIPVQQEIEYEYDSATGLLKKQTTYNYNSLGEKEILIQTSVYGWEKYDALREQNILTPVVQTTSQTNDTITAIAVSTWKEWETDKWGVYKTYQAKTETATFDQWNNQTEPNTTDWLKVSEVIVRTSQGVTEESIDVAGVYSSILLDSDQFYPVAQFGNASIEEVTYTGFEVYENLSNWTVNQGNLADCADCIVTGDAHAGLCSLQLKPQDTLQQRQSLTLSNNNQTYLISAWIKTEAGFETDGGNALVILQFCNGDTSIGDPITILIVGTNGTWQYWYYAIDSSQIQGDYINIKISNQKTSKSFLIDDICFVPLVCLAQINVYDPNFKVVTAELNPNGDTVRHLYDSFLLPAVAEIGLCETVSGVSMDYLVRQGTEDESFVFPQNAPNSKLGISAMNGGVYANLINGEQWQDDWSSSQLDSWQVQNNALVHTGDKSAITFTPTASYTNYGVRLLVYPLETLQNPLGIRIGSQLTITWTPNQGWNLTINGESSTVNATGEMPNRWLLVAANETLLFYADGKPIFSQIISGEVSGAFQLFSADNVEFKNIVTFKAPQIGISYTDGASNQRQTQGLEGKNTLVSGTVYDSLVRPVITTKTARFENTLLAYRPNFVTNIDWETGVLTGELTNYYPQDQGYPYSRTVLEASPLGRPIQQGIPGKDFAITGDNTHIVTSEYGTNIQDFFPGYSYPAGQYSVEKLIDANGTQAYTLKDQLGRTIAKKVGPIDAGSNVYQNVSSVYDDAGNLVKVLLPNYFDPPTGSQPEAWVQTMKYDFLGFMTSQTNPDSGTVKYIYDSAGQPRFMQDAMGSTTQTILYKKYDVIGRVTEEGYFTGDWGDGTALQEEANNDPNYPEQANWCKQYSYDGDGTDPNLIGRLWQVLSCNQDDGTADVEQVYEYDSFGNVVSNTLTVTGYPAQKVGYEYDDGGYMTTADYPDGSSIPEVVYSYNSLGQTIAIGTPDNPQRFATYSYNADGGLATTTLNNGGINSQLAYNSPGWPTLIKNDQADESLVMSQAFNYTSGGYGSSGYYDGSIAKNTLNYGDWEHALEGQEYLYQYDNLSRLKVAQNSQNDEGSLGVGQPTVYDLNGNIETLKEGDSTHEYEYVPNTDKVNEVSDESDPQSYTYDENGNVITASYRNISGIEYDPLTQLTKQVQLGGETPGTVSFKYDGANQRVLKTVLDSGGNPTVTKLYVRGLNDYPLLEVGSQTVQYIFGVGGLIAFVVDSKVYTILKDHLGSTRVVVDEGGTVVAAFDYLPFGDLMGTAYGNPEIINYRYTGQEFDGELGLYNYRARFYDPRLGRFYAIDLAGQYASPYLYAGNNPINLFDPTGMFSWKAFGAILGGAALIVVGVVVTVGLTPFTGGAAAIVGGALIGAGAGSLIYGATHTNNFNTKEWAVYTGLGAAFGAIGGAAGLATAELSTSTALVADIGIGAGLGAADGYVTNGTINSVNGNNFNQGAGAAAGYGALAGGASGAVGGLARAYRSGAQANYEDTPACFVAGTKVAVEDGLVVIEEIETGDLVWAFNERTSEVELYPVLEAFKRTSRYLVFLIVGDEEIITTPEHHFWVEGQGWTPAKGLKQDDILLNKAGKKLGLDKIEMKYKPSQVFNFEVGGAHTYHVSNKQLLVHNTCSTRSKGPSGTSHLRPRITKNYITILGKRYPAFTPDPDTIYVTKRMKFSGDSIADIKKANRDMRYAKTPNGLVWHHDHSNLNQQTLYGNLHLIPDQPHNGTYHLGGSGITRFLYDTDPRKFIGQSNQ